MRIVNADSWRIQPYGSASKELRSFDGGLSGPFHSIRQSLKFALVRWHQSYDPRLVRKGIRQETAAWCKVYDKSKRLTGLRDDFEMHLVMALAIINDRDLAETLRPCFSFRPCANGYAYYAGFKQAVLAMLLDDRALATRATKKLQSFNPTKTFYFPSKAVIFAALDGDMKKLARAVAAISKKFNGYATKTRALHGDTVDASRLDNHWFSPYPDWAFYVQAIRRCGIADWPSTFWMPAELLAFLAGVKEKTVTKRSTRRGMTVGP